MKKLVLNYKILWFAVALTLLFSVLYGVLFSTAGAIDPLVAKYRTDLPAILRETQRALPSLAQSGAIDRNELVERVSEQLFLGSFDRIEYDENVTVVVVPDNALSSGTFSVAQYAVVAFYGEKRLTNRPHGVRFEDGVLFVDLTPITTPTGNPVVTLPNDLLALYGEDTAFEMGFFTATQQLPLVLVRYAPAG